MSNTLLTINTITKDYHEPGNRIKHALKGVSLTIHKGEIISLLGINGAGKTTLSSIIATLHPPTSGDILWNNQSIYTQLMKWRRTIGFCPQHPNLDNELTLEQILIFSGCYYGIPKNEVIAHATTLMKRFGLSEYAQSKPTVLSGGYKQRFLIARTLMHNPSLIIFDEPTVGLDPSVRHDLWNFIKELRSEGITIILTTHYLEEAEILSDRVCILDQGVIKIVDTPNNLKKSFEKKNLEELFLHLTKAE